MNSVDISVVIPPHCIGHMAHHTMRSVFRATAYANERGITTEIVISMDRSDESTREYFSRYEKNAGIIIENVDFGDLGLNRNNGVRLASGKYITLLDDDNLFCQNWLYAAFGYLENSDDEVVAHPEYHVVFGAENFVFRQISSSDPDFHVSALFEKNYWDAVCMVKRDILLRFPYESTTQTPGFGYEDWHWNCQTLAAGIEHHVVPGTAHFMRRKKANSLLSFTNRSNRLIRPTSLFEPALLTSMIEKEKLRKVVAAGWNGKDCVKKDDAVK